jgi:hypothetical protein
MKSSGRVAIAAIQAAEQAAGPQFMLNPMSMSLLESFLDEPSRAILSSTISVSKSIEEVAQENNIPVSTAYRRVHHLVDEGLLMVERIVITDGGKRYSLFRSTFQGATIEVQQNGIQVNCAPNQSIPDIAFRIWRFNNRVLDPKAMD